MEFPVMPSSENGGGIGSAGGGATATRGGTVSYNECQKNHAASIGGHAIDGCCEFLAAGEEGTPQALICAACNCHRNFHRKEIAGRIASHLHQLPPYCHPAALPAPPGFHHRYGVTTPVSQQRTLAPPPVTPHDDVSIPSSSGGSGMKKRFRTKFTQEQKDKLLAFAERIGWRIQKEDEGAIQQFCAENSIKKNVLKVWMHNNKKHKKP